MIKGAIFDVDGTLLDSMGIWKDVGVRYLNSIGIEAEPDLGNILFTMSIQEGAQYVKEHYHLSQETDEIEQNVLDIISDYYKETAPLKSGAVELLEKLRNSNIPMTIASSNNKKEIEMAFERLEIAKYFDRIFTCEEAGARKDEAGYLFAGSRISWNQTGRDVGIRGCLPCSPYCKKGRIPGCGNL